ncbi:MAG: recombinase family protein [Bryobacterales bacterium]|nr:recombinase family protein [Bryobacterales bacterium]MEB2363710.1 recombinase family protein [Bryobacterales bacterium]
MANGSNGNGVPTPVRCAIYTRKSTDEGLNQDFNSLDAQRDAGEAYIRSQAGEGWTLLPDQYDDGGYTGANMDRPALRRLLADIQAKKVDCVVVYKVDRLSRSIRDFGKIMEILEKHGATFVSVTQQFNTTTSLGRLTLNILLSFAQFEREIISERTRDKQILARKRGKWTGGHLPLGYDLEDGNLVINEEEAARVRQIFKWYLEGHSVHGIVAKCEGLGWRNKEWATKEGKTFGGHPMRKCHIYTMLANPLYAARIRAGDEIVAATHPRIVDDNTFDLVQQKLKANTRNPGGEHRPRLEALLRGLLYCAACGSPMSPSYSSSKNRRYRYYVCLRTMQRNGDGCPTRAVSAPVVEEAVIESVRRFAAKPEVIEAIARAARHRMAEELGKYGDELKAVNIRVRNAKSQLVRTKNLDAGREAVLRELVSSWEAKAEQLRSLVDRGERLRFDDQMVRQRMASFDDVWKTLTIEEQARVLRQLIERVGYDARGDKVKVTYNSNGIREFCKEATK